MKYEVVIFDLFGTLVDSYVQGWERARAEIAAALSAPPQDFTRLWVETYDKRATGGFATIEDNLEHICLALGLQVKADQIAAAVQIRRVTRRALTPRPDAVETLTQLKGRGYKIGIISNCSVEVPSLWPDTPFAPLIDAPIFSCAVGFAKPDSRIYQLACEWLKTSPQNCLYVDDVSRYLTGASQVGMDTVLIRVPYEDVSGADEWRGPVISALNEVLTLLG